MEAKDAGRLLRDVRQKCGITQEDLAIRAGTDQATVSDIEAGSVSPSIETFGELFELAGEELVLAAETRLTGIDPTLNRGNLDLSPEERLLKGLAFADFVRRTRRGGADGLGRLLDPRPILLAFDRYEVDFVVIGGIAGLIHGSAYPTYDLDLACGDSHENLACLVSALGDLGVRLDIESLLERAVHSVETAFGGLDMMRRVPGVAGYDQLRRDATIGSIGGCRVQVASLNHLIAMKRVSNQRKDRLMVMEYIVLADEIRRREAEGEKG
jgi:transcriptional regulator with XRE-family HTH domain